MENDARNGREMGNGTETGRIVSARGKGEGRGEGSGAGGEGEHTLNWASWTQMQQFVVLRRLRHVAQTEWRKQEGGQREAKSVLSRTEWGKAARARKRGKGEGERSQDILEAVACAETATWFPCYLWLAARWASMAPRTPCFDPALLPRPSLSSLFSSSVLRTACLWPHVAMHHPTGQSRHSAHAKRNNWAVAHLLSSSHFPLAANWPAYRAQSGFGEPSSLPHCLIKCFCSHRHNLIS